MTWTFGHATDDFNVPDYAEPLIGYRMWRIGIGDTLQSPAQTAVWLPNVPLEAECKLTFSWGFNWWASSVPDTDTPPRCTEVPCGEEHIMNHAGYGCGIYSWSNFDYFLEHGHQAAALTGKQKRDIAIGTCWVWGRVVEQELGYRSQFAALRSLYATHSRVGRIASKFGVELESVPRGLTYRGKRRGY